MNKSCGVEKTLTKDLSIKLPYKILNEKTSEDLKMVSIRYINRLVKNILIFDFSEVNFIEPSGIAALINIWSRCNRKGIKLMICNLNAISKQVFDQKGLDKLIDVIDTYDHAVSQTKNFSYNVIELQTKSYQLESVFGNFDKKKLVLT